VLDYVKPSPKGEVQQVAALTLNRHEQSLLFALACITYGDILCYVMISAVGGSSHSVSCHERCP
jgi:hypothetical protein